MGDYLKFNILSWDVPKGPRTNIKCNISLTGQLLA